MGWFNKKQGTSAKPIAKPMSHPPGNLPELPKLPDLPELPEMKEPPEHMEQPHQLPSFPNSPIGEKFSQNTIKDAVTGKKPPLKPIHPEGNKGDKGLGANDFAKPKKPMRMMPKPLKQKEFTFPKTEEIEEEKEDFDFEDFESPMVEEAEELVEEAEPEEFQPATMPQRKEPVFIRIDKFEEALKTFDKTKKEIAEIEKVLHDIAQVREDEDKELEHWQSNVVKIKDQIEKVDRDIFSRIE